MLDSVSFLWLLFWVNCGTIPVTGLLYEIGLNISALNSRNKIFFSRQSEDASFKLSFNKSSELPIQADVEGWQELIFTNSIGQDCVSPLTRKDSAGHYVVEVCSDRRESQLIVQVVDAINISWAIGPDPSKAFGDAKNRYRIHLIDPTLCILAVLILGILCYLVYMLHDTRRMMKTQKKDGQSAKFYPLQNESKTIQERTLSAISHDTLKISRNSISPERKMSRASIDSKPNSPNSIKPPSDLPPPVPPTPDRKNYQPSSPEKLDSDNGIPLASNETYDEEDHDYDYIDLQKLNWYKDQMKLVGKEIKEKFATVSHHDSENSLYEAVRPLELNTCGNSDPFVHHCSQNSLYEAIGPIESNICGTSDAFVCRGSSSQNSLYEAIGPIESNECETSDAFICHGSSLEGSLQVPSGSPEKEEFGNGGTSQPVTFTQLDTEMSHSVASNQEISLHSDKNKETIHYGSLPSVICGHHVPLQNSMTPDKEEGFSDMITTANQHQQSTRNPDTDFESLDNYLETKSN